MRATARWPPRSRTSTGRSQGRPTASRSSASNPRKGSEMKNYLQNGHILRVTTPPGGIASGDPLIVGNIFGIAAYSSAEGDPVELSTTGVFQLPKASATVLTVGARVAWDNTAKEVNTPAAGRFAIGT